MNIQIYLVAFQVIRILKFLLWIVFSCHEILTLSSNMLVTSRGQSQSFKIKDSTRLKIQLILNDPMKLIKSQFISSTPLTRQDPMKFSLNSLKSHEYCRKNPKNSLHVLSWWENVSSDLTFHYRANMRRD